MISILFLAADPTDASRLRLGEELREIQEKLQLAKLREHFELHQRMSVRPMDISQALLDVQPQIVHFSGHGMTTGELCFENQLGKIHPIEPDALAALFEQFASQVTCVILNACFSEIQASAIARHIECVIGMNQAIGDKAAIAFAIGFYQALGAGRTIEEAYKLGCVQIRLQGIPEHLTPVFIKKGQEQSFQTLPIEAKTSHSTLKMWAFRPRPDFIGRVEEKETFRQVLSQVDTVQVVEPHVLLISGEGGIGKSWLLNEFCAESRAKGLKVFYIDLAIEEPTGTSPKVILYALREQADDLGLAQHFPRFDDALRQLRSVKQENQDDFGLAGLRASTGLIASRWLTDALISDLSQIAMEQTIVIAIDGSEKATGFADWLRSNLLARLSGRIALIVSGRRDSLLEFVSSFSPKRVHQCRVTPFNDKETEHFFHNHKIEIEAETITRVIRLTKGNPLATSMLVALTVSRTGKTSLSELMDDLPQSQIVGGMARHLLADLSPDDLEMVYIMSTLPAFDGAILAYVLEKEQDINVEKLVQRLPFLSLTKYGWRMHENVAKVVFDFFRQSRPTQFRKANERASQFWQGRKETIEATGIQLPQHYSNLEWSTAVNFLFWHLMLSNEDKAAQFVLHQFSEALTYQIHFVTLLELADGLEENLLVVPRIVGILRSIHTNAVKGQLPQLEQNLLIALNLEYCDSETKEYFRRFREIVSVSASDTAIVATQARWQQYTSDCGDCDCDCGSNCACPIWSSEYGMVYYLELTPDCNNVCPGCSNTFIDNKFLHTLRNGKPYLTANDWRKILTRLAPRITGLKVTGGEPTLHPEFAEILGIIADIDVPFVLFTNGRWQSPHHLVEMLRGIPQLRGLLISLHGATPLAHEAFSGVIGSFSETVANIHLAIEAGISVSVSTVLTTKNYNQIDQIIDLANQTGASQVVFNRYIGFPLLELELKPHALRMAIRRIEQLRGEGRKVRFGPCIPSCFASSSASGCLAGTSFAAIDPWGNVKPCTHSPLVTGNLLRQSPASIWNSEKMLLWDSLIPSECEACNEFNECHGGCRALGLILSHSRDPLIAKPPANRQRENILINVDVI